VGRGSISRALDRYIIALPFGASSSPGADASGSLTGREGLPLPPALSYPTPNYLL